MDDDAFERQLIAASKAKRRRTLVFAGIAIVAAIGMLAVVPLSMALQFIQSSNAVVAQNIPAPEPELGDVMPDPQPATGTVSVEPEDEPEPEPEPEPAPVAPKVTSLRGLLDRGWTQVATNPAAAASTFQKALNMNASNPEANYGYGYALLEQGNTAGANPYLCRAVAGNDIDTQRDVAPMLTKHSLTCP
jgi:hypothetical protein